MTLLNKGMYYYLQEFYWDAVLVFAWHLVRGPLKKKTHNQVDNDGVGITGSHSLSISPKYIKLDVLGKSYHFEWQFANCISHQGIVQWVFSQLE